MGSKIRVYGAGICRDAVTGRKLIKFIDGYADIDLRDFSDRQIENIKRRFKFKLWKNATLVDTKEEVKSIEKAIEVQEPIEILVDTNEVYSANRKKLVEIAKKLEIEGKLMTFETEVLRNKILNKLKEKANV